VLHHEQSGRIVEGVLRYAAVSNDLQLYSRQDGIFMSKETIIVSHPLPLFSFGSTRNGRAVVAFSFALFCRLTHLLFFLFVQSVNVSDISELRPGSHSLAFVRSGSTANDKEVRAPFFLPHLQYVHPTNLPFSYRVKFIFSHSLDAVHYLV
jgi:hypothetical protein